MLQRQVEPELMNATAQVEAYAAADFSQSDQALVAWIAHRFPAGLGDRVIDLGCGPGNIALLLVQQCVMIGYIEIQLCILLMVCFIQNISKCICRTMGCLRKLVTLKVVINLMLLSFVVS